MFEIRPKPPTDATGTLTVRYKGLVEKIHIFTGERRVDLRIRLHLHVENPQKIHPEGSVDCCKHQGKCLPEGDLVEIIPGFQVRLREQNVHNGERRHQTHARLPQERHGALEVLLLEALLNPVLHLVVLDDLLRKTLQNLSWKKTLKTNRRPPTPPSPAQEPTLGSWAPPCTNVMLTAVSSLQLRSSAGRGSLSRRRRHSTDRVLKATRSHRTSHVALGRGCRRWVWVWGSSNPPHPNSNPPIFWEGENDKKKEKREKKKKGPPGEGRRGEGRGEGNPNPKLITSLDVWLDGMFFLSHSAECVSARD